MPAGPPPPPGRIPGGVLARLVRFPQREIERVVLAIGSLHAFPLVHLVDVAVAELAVFGVAPNPEIDVSVDRVGMSALDQASDQSDHAVDRLACERLKIGSTQPKSVGVGDIERDHLLGELVARSARLARCRVDLVVDIRNIRHEHDAVPLMDEEALHNREHDEGAGIPNVDAAVHGRAAHVDPDRFPPSRPERPHRPGARVVQRNISSQGPGTLAAVGMSARTGM